MASDASARRAQSTTEVAEGRHLLAATGMKLILSRKGFDSGSRWRPEPRDAGWQDGVLADSRSHGTEGVRRPQLGARPEHGDIIRDLAPARVRPDHFAHLDPDLDQGTVQRQKGWRPIFGQAGSSQTHLANSGVGAGDVFLFFGLFRKAHYRQRAPFFRRRRQTGARPVWMVAGRLCARSGRMSRGTDWAPRSPAL